MRRPVASATAEPTDAVDGRDPRWVVSPSGPGSVAAGPRGMRGAGSRGRPPWVRDQAGLGSSPDRSGRGPRPHGPRPPRRAHRRRPGRRGRSGTAARRPADRPGARRPVARRRPAASRDDRWSRRDRGDRTGPDARRSGPRPRHRGDRRAARRCGRPVRRQGRQERRRLRPRQAADRFLRDPRGPHPGRAPAASSSPRAAAGYAFPSGAPPRRRMRCSGSRTPTWSPSGVELDWHGRPRRSSRCGSTAYRRAWRHAPPTPRPCSGPERTPQQEAPEWWGAEPADGEVLLKVTHEVASLSRGARGGRGRRAYPG